MDKKNSELIKITDLTTHVETVVLISASSEAGRC